MTSLPIINLCKQPVPWGCYPTAVSILTGISYDKLIKTIRHDGSKLLDVSGWKWETFSHSEMAWVLIKFGWALIPIAAAIQNPDKSIRTQYPSIRQLINVIERKQWKTIIIVQKPKGHHALAWCPACNKIIDPLVGQQISFELPYPIETFEILLPIK